MHFFDIVDWILAECSDNLIKMIGAIIEGFD